MEYIIIAAFVAAFFGGVFVGLILEAHNTEKTINKYNSILKELI